MCAALELNSRVVLPGRLVGAWKNIGAPCRFVWAGFATVERMDWWTRQGWTLVDVPAHRFAERSERTRRLAWDEVPRGFVVRGVIELGAAAPTLKIVTRAANAEELVRFEHPRMPLIDAPLFSAEWLPLVELELESQRGTLSQGELF